MSPSWIATTNNPHEFRGYPEWTSNLTVNWSRDNWNVSLAWRHIDEMDIDEQIGFEEFVKDVDSVDYFDVYGSYDWDNIRLSLGIENIGDEEPPFIPSISTNTNPTYDFLGRFYSARIKFTL